MNQNPAHVFALKLHALHQDDREWILSRLENDAQERLMPLLSELNALGLKVDSTVIDAIEHQTKTDSPNDLDQNEIGLDVNAEAMVNSASSAQIKHIFDDEPVLFLQCLSTMKNWSWLSDLNQRDTNHLTDQTNRNGKTSTVAVKQALMKAVAGQLIKENSLGLHLMAPQVTHELPSKRKTFLQKIVDRAVPWKK